MGDEKQPYRPRWKAVPNDVNDIKYSELVTRECRDESVVKKYGKGKPFAFVTLYQCQRCRNVIRSKFTSGLRCKHDVKERGEKDGKK